MPILMLFSTIFDHWSAKAIDIALGIGAAVFIGWYLLNLHDEARDNAAALANIKIVDAAKDQRQAEIVKGMEDINLAAQANLVRVANTKAALHELPASTACIGSPGVKLLNERLQQPAQAGPGAAPAHP